MRPIRHMKKVVMVSALLLILTLSLGGGVASKGNDTAATYENLRLFTEVLSIVQSQYVDEVPPKDIIYNAIKGTLRGLDPHSSFLDPEIEYIRVRQFQEQTAQDMEAALEKFSKSGKFQGLVLDLRNNPGGLLT